MRDIEELLSSLREHGTIDSAGEFTVSLGQARRKLTQYHSSERGRYLLLLVSAGVASGAQEIAISQGESSYRVVMREAYIPELALLNAFAKPSQESEVPGASDLVLGLQAAFGERATEIRVEVHSSEQSSFCWTLTPDGEESKTRPSSERCEIEVDLQFRLGWRDKFAAFFAQFRGYASLRPEGRLVDRYCDRARIPITINRSMIRRPLFLPEMTLTAQVGSLEGQQLEVTPHLHLDGFAWSGALALGTGRVQAVIHGVAYCELEETGLEGTVYHDGLRRDLGREKIVRDGVYEALVDELQEVWFQMVDGVALRMAEIPDKQAYGHLGDVLLGLLMGRISEQGCTVLAGWLGVREGENTTLGLYRVGYSLLEDARAKERLLQRLLQRCSEILGEQNWGQREALETAFEVLRLELPEETLLSGYLLLGLGALHSLEGHENEAQKAWFRSLDVVWSGQDDRAQELIYTHMGYEAKHIVGQAAAAIQMGLHDLVLAA